MMKSGKILLSQEIHRRDGTMWPGVAILQDNMEKDLQLPPLPILNASKLENMNPKP